MVERKLPKLHTRVRFPSPAPKLSFVPAQQLLFALRNCGAMKPHSNAGYGDIGFIQDRNCAKNPEHYVRALILIQNDLQLIFEYLEPSVQCRACPAESP